MDAAMDAACEQAEQAHAKKQEQAKEAKALTERLAKGEAVDDQGQTAEEASAAGAGIAVSENKGEQIPTAEELGAKSCGLRRGIRKALPHVRSPCLLTGRISCVGYPSLVSLHCKGLSVVWRHSSRK